MARYLIERHIPGASALTQEQLQKIAEKSLCAMEHLNGYTWLHTYVAGDRLLCVHEAPSEDIIREHSRRGGFPIERITEIATVFGPETADGVKA